LQHCVALVLLHGAPTLADFREDALQAPDLVALRAKVSVVEDVQMTASFPAHYAASLTVTLQDGRRFTHQQQDAKGDPERPLTHEEIVGKARMLLVAAGASNVESLIDATLALPMLRNVSNWTSQWAQSWKAAA
jgi:2-methylcitrate dehydratase PrpD